MFTWICPKCGAEVPPSYSECPTCAIREGRQMEAPKVVTPRAAPAPVAPAAAPAAPTPPAPEPVPVPSFYGGGSAEPEAPRGGGGIPGWLVAILSLAGFAGLVVGGFYVMRGKLIWDTGDGADPAAAKPAVEDTAPIQQVEGSHPLAKYIEVTGLRLIGTGGKAQLKFLVVNHSAGPLDGIQLEVNIRERTSKPGEEGAVLFTVTTPIRRIGAFESRDYTVPVTAAKSGLDLPDWQFLRATFKVANP